MQAILRVAIASALIGTSVGAFAQDGTTSGDTLVQQQPAAHEELVRVKGAGAPAVSNTAEVPETERQQPVQELIRTEVVYPQEQGELQLSLGSLFDNGRVSDSIAIPFGLEYGLTDAWQVGLEWAPVTHERALGSAITQTGEPTVGTKYSFMNIGGFRTHAAIGIEVGIPRHIESGVEGRRHLEAEPYAIFAADLNRRGLQVFGQMGLAFAAAGDNEDEGGKELQWNAGALVPLGSITFATELDVRNESVTFRDAHEVYITPSITLTRHRPWEFGIGVPVGLTSESTRVGLAILMSYER